MANGKLFNFDKEYARRTGRIAPADRRIKDLLGELEAFEAKFPAIKSITQCMLLRASTKDLPSSKINHPVSLIKNEDSLYVAFTERYSYCLGMLATKGHGKILASQGSPLVETPDVLAVCRVYGPLSEAIMKENSGKEGILEKFEGQPSVTSPDADQFYDGLRSRSFLYFTSTKVLANAEWLAALNRKDTDLLDYLSE
jgi:hypothetical protein